MNYLAQIWTEKSRAIANDFDDIFFLENTADSNQRLRNWFIEVVFELFDGAEDDLSGSFIVNTSRTE